MRTYRKAVVVVVTSTHRLKSIVVRGHRAGSKNSWGVGAYTYLSAKIKHDIILIKHHEIRYT